MVSGRRRPPREGPFALAATSQSINLAAHLSISSRRKKVSLHHASCFLRVADAAPTNGVFFELFLALDSLCYLFRKKFIVCNSLSRFLLLHVSELLWRSFVVEVFQCYNSCRGGVNVDGYLQSTALPHLLFFSSPLLSFTRLKARARVVLLPPPHRLLLLLTPAGARRRHRPRRRRPRPPCPRSRV